MKRIFGVLLAVTTWLSGVEKPNVVLIYCDDLGYGDVGCFGAEGWETPHIDSIAQEGVKFTDFYVAQAVCSASRCALLTGCYANRLGIHGALFPASTTGLNPEETTLAEVCKSVGYATAMFGKWHLGYQEPFLPVNQGFDEYHGYPYSNDMWPSGPVHFKAKFPQLPVYEGAEIVRRETDQTEMTKTLTERSVAFIEKNKETPFFLYLAHPQPHVPLYVSEERKGSSKGGLYGDVIQEIDWSTGQVLAALEKAGVEEKTLVIFTSDNGPWMVYGNHGGVTGGLRGSKGTSWEGGVRVPCVMKFPGRLKAGSVVKTPVMTIDLLPTIAGLIGAALPEKEIDGKDAWKVLTGEREESVQEAYFFFYGRGNLEAMRMGKWKLQFPHKWRDEKTHPGKDGLPGKYLFPTVGLELFDLEADRNETRDVSAEHPEVMARMQALADQKRAELGDGFKKLKGLDNREPGKAPVAEWAK
ncbi:MAG: sulfatase family protein [Verrucomicrobiaceae bacterium]